MCRKPLTRLTPSINLPFLPGNTKPADTISPKFKPITTLMLHKSGIFVIVLFGFCFQLVLVLLYVLESSLVDFELGLLL